MAASVALPQGAHAQGTGAKPPTTGAAPKAAAPAARKPGGVPAVALSPDVVQKLKSTDPGQVKSALDEVRVAGKGAASVAPEVAAVLDRGVSASLAIDVLDTLADLEVDATNASILPYMQHRNVKVRQAATKALVHTKGSAAAKALRHGLSDPDGMVRGVSASGLGTLKAKDAVPDLFIALEHRVAEAAAALGQLCNAEDCEKLMTYLGRQPFDVISGGLDQILFRPTAEVSEDTKVKVIGRVRELGTPEANKFLRDVQKRWRPTDSPRVKQAIEQGVQATGGSSVGGDK
jgi:HEAT repeat protein